MSRALAVVLASFAAAATAGVPGRAGQPAAAAGGPPSPPSYQRHVTALFSRLGCNGGACHGAVRGQNGFRLSLFGADPEADHARLLHELAGRRLNFAEPEASLLLLKGAALVPHQGGRRLTPGGPEYRALRDWIAAGAPADPPGPSRLRELRVSPAEKVARPGEAYPLRAEAHFADGTREDVTAYCSFQSLDAGVAGADPSGLVTPRGTGEAGVIVRYRQHTALAQVLVPLPAGSAPPAEVRAHNFIDEHVLAKLRRLNLPPADLADDATFLRRACLDVTGELPAPVEVRAFLANSAPDKRERKVEELLARPGHAALWTLKFCDLLKAADFGVYADALSLEADAPRFQAWVRARLEENLPYDELVARILLATSREGRTPEDYAKEVQALLEGNAPGRKDLGLYAGRKTLDLFWQRKGADGVGGALQVAHAFLGLRLECAQCHRHPHDVWQQDDLLDFANYFMRVRKIGFEGDNEKRFPDTAALFKRFNDEGKKLEAEHKKRKDAEGKKVEEDARKARTEVDRLAGEVARRQKDPKAAGGESLEALQAKLAAARAALARAEKARQELSDLERRAKLMPEVARRLLQAEVRLLPGGPKAPAARVTSTLGTRESKAFRLPGHTEAAPPPQERDPREVVVAWLRRPDNPYFARALVNRVWAHYFGRGIVDPPDNLSAFNPPSHPALLAELADGFALRGYDLRWLHRTILASRTYQQSGPASPEAAADRGHCASFPLRRLPAEVLLDALNSATGTTEAMDMKYHHWPEGLKTVEVPFSPRNPFVAYVLENFGRPKRNAAVQCDCERDGSASVFQVLTLANHPRVWEKVRDPAGRAAVLAKAPGEPAARVEELFLATLSRPPSTEEREACLAHLRSAETPEKGLQGVLWGLINTREFLLQH